MGSHNLVGEMHTLGAALLFVGSASAFPLAFPDGPAGPLPIPRPGSDGSYAGDNYFQYIHGGGYKEPHPEPAYAPPAPAYSAGSEPEGTYVAAPGDSRNRRSLGEPVYYFILA